MGDGALVNVWGPQVVLGMLGFVTQQADTSAAKKPTCSIYVSIFKARDQVQRSKQVKF